MKLQTWAVFIGVQVLACALITARSPLILRWIGGILLLPASALLLAFGEKIVRLIQGQPLVEGIAIALFFSFNAFTWHGVARHFAKASR